MIELDRRFCRTVEVHAARAGFCGVMMAVGRETSRFGAGGWVGGCIVAEAFICVSLV